MSIELDVVSVVVIVFGVVMVAAIIFGRHIWIGISEGRIEAETKSNELDDV